MLLLIFKGLTVSVLPVMYINFLYVWLAHVVSMLKVIDESQENTEILKHHKAHSGFLLLHKSSTDEMRIPKQCTSKYCSWSLSYRSVK